MEGLREGRSEGVREGPEEEVGVGGINVVFETHFLFHTCTP